MGAGHRENEETDWWRGDLENMLCSLGKERRNDSARKYRMLTRKNPLKRQGVRKMSFLGCGMLLYKLPFYFLHISLFVLLYVLLAICVCMYIVPYASFFNQSIRCVEAKLLIYSNSPSG